MDQIIIKNIHLTGTHGVLDSEKINPQPFLFTLTLYTNTQPAAHSDNLRDTIDYADAYQILHTTFHSQSFNLIETLAHTVATNLLQDLPKLHKVDIELKKPKAPLPATFDYTAIKITRHAH